MSTEEKLKQLTKLAQLIKSYLEIASANKKALTPEQITQAKAYKEQFATVQKARKALTKKLKQGDNEEQVDPQVKEFLDNVKQTIDGFDGKMKEIEKAIEDAGETVIEGGKALLEKI